MQEIQETWVWFLHQQDPLKEGMATHSSILAWRIPWSEESGRLQSMGVTESDMTELTQHFVHIKGYRIDQPQAWGSAVSTRWVKLGDGCGKGRERNQVDSWLSNAGQKKQPFAE